MTRREFLNDLYRRLGDMPQEEAEQHLTYYAEMLADRMEEGMTEEEAVASMEDVGIIAGRILQDRAAAAGSSVPPRYPDPPMREAAPKHAAEKYTAPARRCRRWVPIVIGLLVALAVVPPLLGILGLGRYQGIHIGNDGIRIGGLISIDNSGIRLGPGGSFVSVTNEGIEVGPDGSVVSVTDKGIEVGPDGAITSVTDEGIAVGGTEIAPVEGVTAEEPVHLVPAQDVKELRINWVSGEVDVQIWNEDSVSFQERASVPLAGNETLRSSVKSGVLTIDFSDGSLKNLQSERSLTVWVPRSLVLRELQMDTVSASCLVDANVKKIAVDTVSGEVRLGWCSDLKDVNFDSVSGDMILELPEDAGFELTFDSASGIVDSGSFAFMQSHDGVWVGGDGQVEIKANTVSGDVVLIVQ